MSYCKCKDLVNIEIFFGIVIFSIIIGVSAEKFTLLFEEIEWYRALGVILGSITVAATVGVIASLSAKWIIQNIGLVIFIITIIWAYSLTL